jgi:predicted nucleic acid-binding protein
MTDKCFIDTNLFIYALTDPRDELDQAKHVAALSFFKETIQTFDIFTSVQVLNESHSILTKKFKIPDLVAYDLVSSAICNISTVQSLTVET